MRGGAFRSDFSPAASPVKCTLCANRSVAAVSFFCAPKLLCESAALVVPSRAYSDCSSLVIAQTPDMGVNLQTPPGSESLMVHPNIAKKTAY